MCPMVLTGSDLIVTTSELDLEHIPGRYGCSTSSARAQVVDYIEHNGLYTDDGSIGSPFGGAITTEKK